MCTFSDFLRKTSTSHQLVLVGVCCTEGPDGRDLYAEISVQPLPDYTISSDGVTMTCVTCTNKGRIFMAGRDGHIYELLYTTGSGWNKRCRKVCLTAGVGSMISRYTHSLCPDRLSVLSAVRFWNLG